MARGGGGITLPTTKRGSDWTTDVSAHNAISFNVLILDEYDSCIKTESILHSEVLSHR